jgi:hypothetical protein
MKRILILLLVVGIAGCAAKSGDNSEEPGDYPFGINPAGYTSRSMIVICK